MTKEQEEAIKRLEKRIKDNEDYKITQVWLTDDVSAVYTVLNMLKRQQIDIQIYEEELDKIYKALNIKRGVAAPETAEIIKTLKNTISKQANMLKEKDKEIENKKKSLDNLENELNRLSERNLELFEESFEAQKKNEYWKSRIEKGKKDVKGLKTYEIGIVCDDLKEEIEKKDKIINEMIEEYEYNDRINLKNFCDEEIRKDKCIENCTICITQYFERKENNEN